MVQVHDRGFRRSYVVADAAGPASGEGVAAVLRRAAAALDDLGDIDVHHLALDTDDRSHTSSVTLTVYFDPKPGRSLL